jgi:hypothetical protein
MNKKIYNQIFKIKNLKITEDKYVFKIDLENKTINN